MFFRACRALVVMAVMAPGAFMASAVSASWMPAQAAHNAEAVRLNNNGVALMNQQQTERAHTAFAAAFAKDPAFADAALNDGIALLYLQRVPEAVAALKSAQALSPNNPRVWYNLGLVDRAANDLPAAAASFQHAAQLDPADADSWYFAGVCLQDLKQPEAAVAAFTTALEKNPQHASAEFAMARSLQRSGHADQAREHFQRFQHLTAAKVSSALGLSYGDQGRYSMAVAFAEPPHLAPAMIPVRFESHPLLATPSAVTAASSGGSCMIDFDNDGLYDLLLMSSGAHAIRLLRNRGDGSFEEIPAAQTGLTATGHAVSCTAGDYDNDGLPDIAVALDDQVLLFHNQGNGHFENTTQASGLLAHNHPQGITFIDYDHDGDLDLVLTGSGLVPGAPANVLWRNNGNRTFTDVTEATALGGSGHTTSAMLTDLNNDRAVDIVVAGDGNSPVLYLNPREGKYPHQPLFTDASLGATTGVTVLDFNKDGWMDLAVTHAGAPGVTLWRNVAGKGQGGIAGLVWDRGFERVELPIHDAIRAWGVTPIDFDNDGWIDLAVLVDTARGAELRMLRNLGDGSFADVSKSVGLDKLTLDHPRGLIAVDAAHDGAAGLIVTSTGGDPVFLRNVGGNRNHSVRLQLTGFADNKSAIGTKVEVFSSNGAQKWEIAGASGYLSQGPAELLIGLGDAPGIDMVRMLWPTGVPQDEISLTPKPAIALTEADRRGSSCPVLFAWDGKRFGLITDTIGAAVVGHWFTPSRRNISDPDEWIRVEGRQLTALHGRLSLRFTEPMEEVNYIDQLRLRAIDHPIGTQVYPDERFLDQPPFAGGAAVLSAQAQLPLAAHDDQGRDMLDLIATADHRFASSFSKLPYDGFANQHGLTLDIGQQRPAQPLRLLMTGYVEYFSATSLYAAWQAGIAPISPYIEAQLPDGSWQLIEKDMGFPAGLERTIVVDLTGKLPANSTRIRIVTNLQIYWDQIRIDSTPANATLMRQTEIPLAQARLRFHGYPRQIDGASPGDLNYDYDLVSLTGPFQRQRGSYTRFGDVTPLLTGVDNRFAIFGSGEEIAADFDATQLPPLPPHWQRDYFFYANGFVKDMDYYDALPFTVAQLPFHGMTTYPYPGSESFPADPAAIAYQLNWNDRFDTGAPSQSFHFDYQPHPSTPE